MADSAHSQTPKTAQHRDGSGDVAGTRRRDAFVGRTSETTRLQQIVDDTISGHGRLVMFSGEPGIGKTRLAEEVAKYATANDARVLWGHCHERKGAPPYWPWIESIRSYLSDSDSTRLAREVGSSGGVVAELITEIREVLPDLPIPVALDNAESSRFRLFDALSTFLARASETRPVVMVLDDLHWADESTLELLEFIASDIGSTRLLIIGTYRDVELGRTHPLETALGELARRQTFERIVLRGLNRPAVVDLMHLTGGIKPDIRLAAAVHERTEGNPFFVGEVVRLLAQTESPEAISNKDGRVLDIRIPEGIRQVIGRRLNNLSDQCNEVLITAAVVGRVFSVDLLSRLLEEMSEDELIVALEEALSVRMLDEQSNMAGYYRFTHALVQQTLIDELSLTRRVKLHSRIARSLEELYGENAGDHAAELVTHFGEAETILGTEKIARYSLLAGRQAEERFAWDEARRHYQQGVEARSGTVMDDERAKLLVGLARAMTSVVASGMEVWREAYEILRTAYEYFADQRNVDALIDIAEIFVWGPVVDGRAHYLGEDAVLLVERGSLDEARLLPDLIEYRNHWGEPRDGLIQECKRGLDIAVPVQDRQLEMRLRSTLCSLELESGSIETALQEAEAALTIAEFVVDPIAEVNCHHTASWSALNLGKAGLAFAHNEAMIAASEKLSGTLGWRLYHESILYRVMGRWDDAADFAKRLVELDIPYIDLTALGLRARILAEVGELERAKQLISRITAHMQAEEHAKVRQMLDYTIFLAQIALIIGDSARIDHIAEHVRVLLASAPRNEIRIGELNDSLAWCAVVRSDMRSAAELYETIRTHLPLDSGGADNRRLCGLLAHTAGMLEKAAEHFQESIDFSRKSGYLPELGWACCNYAELLMEGGDAFEHAAKLLDEGLGIAEKLGMKPLKDRIVERQTRLVDFHAQAQSEPKAKAPAYPDGLTKREVEVLQLVAKGFTNKEIADLLHISNRTVSTHVSNILEKTGTANRAEATAYAIHHGLVDE